MDKKKIIILALLGIGMFIGILALLNSITGGGSGATAKETVVIVAKQDIPALTLLKEDMLFTKKIKTSDVSEDHITDMKDAVGKINVSKLSTNDTIKESLLTTKDNKLLGIAPAIGEGMRAVSIKVDLNEGLSGLLKQGNYVDIVAIYNQSPDKELSPNSIVYGNSKAFIVTQNVKILALGVNTNPESQEVTTQKDVYTTVTLEVTPDQALAISLASSVNNTKLNLLLRSQEDKTQTQDPGRNLL